MKELTYLLGMSRQAIAQLLDKLEKSGIITREPSEEDRRVSIVRLTDKGREAADVTGAANRANTGVPEDAMDTADRSKTQRCYNLTQAPYRAGKR